MRKPLLSLAIGRPRRWLPAASSASSSGRGRGAAPAPGTSPARRTRRPAAGRERRTAGSPTRTRAPTRSPTRRGPGLDLRDGRRHRLVRDRPALRRRRQHARSGQRPGRGVGQRVRPGLSGARTTPPSAIHVDGAPSPFLASTRRPAPGRHPGPRRRREREPAGGRADVRHRHLRLDGARGPARARQGLAAPAGPRSRARRFDRRRDVRRRRARRAAADHGDRRRPDPGRHRRAPAERLDQPRGRPRARLPAGARDPARRRRHRPGRPRLGRRRERRADRRRRHPPPDPRRRRGRHRAGRRSGSGWATTTTPCSSSWPTRATASTPTSTTGRRPAAVHRRPDLDAPDRRARRQGAGRVRSRRRRRRTGSSGTRTGPSPTATSAIRASTPAPSGPATRSPPSTTSRSARASPADDRLGTVRLRWTEPGARPTSRAPERRSGPATWRRGSRRPIRLPARRDRGRHGRGPARQDRGSDGPDLRDDPRRRPRGRRPPGHRPGPRLPAIPRADATSSAAEPPAIGRRAVAAGPPPSPGRPGQAGSPSVGSVGGRPDPRRQLAGAPRDRRDRPAPTAAGAADDAVSRSSAPMNSTTNARISECSVQAACGMSAGHRPPRRPRPGSARRRPRPSRRPRSR